MPINLRRAFRYGLLVIGASVLTNPLGAQQARLAPTAVGQIIDEVLGELFPLGKSVSRIPVTQREIFLDHARTIAAFGHDAAQTIPSSGRPLQAAVKSGTKDLLEDCSQVIFKPCQKLGWSVYVSIEPVSISTSEALVRAYVVWPDRGSATFEEAVPPKGRALLVGYLKEIQLARSPDADWKFVKQGRTIVF